jgi:hypothetical protein
MPEHLAIPEHQKTPQSQAAGGIWQPATPDRGSTPTTPIHAPTGPGAAPGAAHPLPTKEAKQLFGHWAEDGAESGAAPASGAATGKERTAGQPVPAELRAQLEQTTGTELSEPRLHTDQQAAAAASGVNARAVTLGQDVFFASGEFQPGTPDGNRLIAHELVHTIQQRGQTATPSARLPISQRGDRAETEADRVAAAALDGTGAAPSPVRERPGPQLARKENAGAEAHDETSQKDKDGKEQGKPTKGSPAYEAVLGHFLGSHLYKILAEHIQPEKLKSYAKKGVDAAIAKLTALASDHLGESDEEKAQKEKELLKSIQDELTSQMEKIAEDLLNTDGGKKFLKAIGDFVDSHPRTVLILALVAAAGAITYAATSEVEIPKFSKDLKDKVRISGSAKLKKLIPQAAELSLETLKGSVRFKAGFTYDAKDGYGAEAGIHDPDDKNSLSTTAKIDKEGHVIIDVTGKAQVGNLSADGKLHQPLFGEKTTTGELNLKLGDDDNFVKTSFMRDGELLKATLGTQQKLRLFNLSLNGDFQHQQGQADGYGGGFDLSMPSGLGFAGDIHKGKDGINTSFTQRFSQDGLNFSKTLLGSPEGFTDQTSLSISDKEKRNSLSFELTDKGQDGRIDAAKVHGEFLPADDLKLILDYGRTIEGKTTFGASVKLGNDKNGFGLSYNQNDQGKELSATGHLQNDHWASQMEAKYHLDGKRLELLRLALGFQDPEQFTAFCIEFSRKQTTSSTGQAETSYGMNTGLRLPLGDRFHLLNRNELTFHPDGKNLDYNLNLNLLRASGKYPDLSYGVSAWMYGNTKPGAGRPSFDVGPGFMFKDVLIAPVVKITGEGRPGFGINVTIPIDRLFRK